MRWLALVLGMGCAPGTWSVRVVGEPLRAPRATDDGCSLELTAARVGLADRALVDEAGARLSRAGAPWVGRVDREGTRSPAVEVPPGRYQAVWLEVGEVPGPPAAPGLDVDVVVGCDDAAWTLSVGLPGPARQECLSSTLDVLPGEHLEVAFEVLVPALFVDDLDAPLDAPVVVRPLTEADADADGAITPAELAAVPLTRPGYRTSGPDAPTDLLGFLEARSGRVGRVPGSWCRVAPR